MIQKKICLLGRTPSRNRIATEYFECAFDGSYLSTIGVSIHRKSVEVGGSQVRLLLWNISDKEEFQRTRRSYLRGMSGYALVIDESDATSAERALRLHELAKKTVGDVPFVTLFVDESADDAFIKDAAVRKLVDKSFQKLAQEVVHARTN